MGEPTDDAIALAGFLLGAGWWSAAAIREALERLGFEVRSTVWLASHLTSMCKESAPRFERNTDLPCGYRVTAWAATGLCNQWRGFVAFDYTLPTPFPKAQLQKERSS